MPPCEAYGSGAGCQRPTTASLDAGDAISTAAGKTGPVLGCLDQRGGQCGGGGGTPGPTTPGHGPRQYHRG
eukprot:2880014-Lingulodinium_polyedra.AAC.1